MAASTVCSTRGLAPGDRSGDGASERFFGLLVGTENLALERGSKGKARGGLALRGIPWSTTAGLEPNVIRIGMHTTFLVYTTFWAVGLK